ncbi:hypothetical protein HIM_02829 [Hirsutella minnesotensis 3608]|nr:hypothetical protein HIM_02829 [Hirsutella minnesotensis 3608]
MEAGLGLGRHHAQTETLRSSPPTTVLPLPDLHLAVQTRSQVQPDSTITPYYNGLNGVDGPTNMACKDLLWGSLGILGIIILTIRIADSIRAKLRQIATMATSTERQTFWKEARWPWMLVLKKHVLYAPLWRKRHNREFRPTPSLSLGTLPSRLHLILIVFYGASNIVYMAKVGFQNPNRYALLAELRGRSGTLSIANMVPLIIFAGRNNPLIPLLKVSFDTFNFFHRWIGRIVVAQILIHTICWTIPVVADGGWGLVGRKLVATTFITSGMLGTLCMVLLLFLSISPIRHAFYETFLNIHVLLAAVIFVTTWMHCASANVKDGLPQLPWIMAIVYLWFADRAARAIRTLFVNWSGAALTSAHCEALPGDVTRVTLRLPRYLDIKPGTHAYLRFWGCHAWENHPFSIAWVEHTAPNEDLPVPAQSEKHSPVKVTTSATFIIGAHKGFTRRLFKRSMSCPRGISMKATMEGPYGGHQKLNSYGHVLLFAGSTGITHQMSFIRPLLDGYRNGTVSLRRLVLIWVIRDIRWIDWIRPHLDRLADLSLPSGILHLQVFITRPPICLQNFEVDSKIDVFPGRPNVAGLVASEVSQQVGAMCVSVCGPGGLADDVRSAVRANQDTNIIDFFEESFTW